MKNFFFLLCLSICLSCQNGAHHEMTPVEAHSPEAIKGFLSQYEPYEMSFDASGYNENDKLILKKLVKAAAYVDTIFWQQTSKYGMKLRDSLEVMKGNPVAKELLQLVKRNGGPFELLNDHAAFIGDQSYYAGGELYPKGMTAAQFDAYVSKLSEDEKAEFMNPYTVIKEDGNGGYKAVRYSEEYKSYITPMVALLREVAELTENDSFAKFLNLKATALTTDNYYDADVAWIETEDAKFDIVFGPFETYSDGIKGVKAKYEAYIEIVDEEGSKDLEKYTKYLKEMEENLPIPDEYKSVVEGLTANFIVVRDIIRTGEGSIGYQAVATNLPNDPEVHKTKGTKKTFWKNMFEARFNAIIKPVSNRLIDTEQQKYLSHDGFFQFVLMHEICHAIGPRTVKVGENAGQPVNNVIGPNYNALEEAKADVVGLYSLAYLMEKGVVDKSMAREFYVSFLGSLFRSIRFGLEEAHGKAAAISLNYLELNKAIRYNAQEKRWAIHFDHFEKGIEKLATKLLILEGDGDPEKVQEFFDRWTGETPALLRALEHVKDIPIDVLPVRSINWAEESSEKN